MTSSRCWHDWAPSPTALIPVQILTVKELHLLLVQDAPQFSKEEMEIVVPFLQEWERVLACEMMELTMQQVKDLMMCAISCLFEPRRMCTCTLPELLFHVKNATLETACAEALRELEMERVSWPILEAHMKNMSFPTIQLMHCHAHRGMTTEELKAHTTGLMAFPSES